MSALTRFSLFSLWAGLGWVFAPSAGLAQSALCPVNALNQTQPFSAQHGACTNGNFGSFSGAALASQALSELSQSTSQELTRETQTSLTQRKEQEIERCAEGFSRVDGVCEPHRAVVAEPQPPSPQESAPVRKKPIKISKKSKPTAEPKPAPKLVYRAPASPAPAIFIEPAIRFGAWIQVNGDYEHRDASGPGSINCCTAGPAALTGPAPLTLGVQSRTGTIGFQGGADFTSRGVLAPQDGMIAGLLFGYTSSTLVLNTQAFSGNFAQVGNEYSRLHATLTGPTVGLYGTYFTGAFSADFLTKVDILSVQENFNDSLAFCACFGSAAYVPFAGSGSTNLLNTTIAANLNYKFDINPNFWVQPTVGAQYTNLNYSSSAAALGLDDGSVVMIQGGARFGTTTVLGGRVLTTLSLTGLAYDDVLVSGGFIPAASYAGNNLLAQADQGQVRGRGILALNFDFGSGLSSYIQADVRGGTGLFGVGGKAGVRMQW